ncbi:cytochrome b/b6 domain-containing protein [Arenicella xantha]|uniref:Cytochrome b n=1 Tax=Arenicella xantha TaxID=644221 RepID=A0A395JK98_9GAMM|nr:cytochrome b/b6 domain-containing protein [Arenicella xantha]RBP51196.1 cytochrome b [Arenicella xantha]
MSNTTLVWDLPTRLFHWLLVLAVSYSWISIEILENMQHHFYAGYTVLTLLLFRVIWGMIGSYYSRLSRLVFPVSEITRYAKQLFSRSSDVAINNSALNDSSKKSAYLGHNPLGSLSVIAILLILITQVGLGLFSTDDYAFGPLAGLVSADMRSTLTELHHDNVTLIYAILALHILAIAFYQFFKKESLTRAMVTGKKLGEPSNINKIRSTWLALVVLAISIGAVYWLTTAFIDQLPQADYY